jgi:LmbE family N-acetylglucosaminyl deacetylase
MNANIKQTNIKENIKQTSKKKNIEQTNIKEISKQTNIKENKTKNIIFSVILIITFGLFICIFPYLNVKNINENQLINAGISQCDNLMIVAHPDDETIFGGDHLINGNYFILCITCGNNKTRKTEFEKVLKETHCKGIILSYPDKIFNKRSDWTFCKDSISQDVLTAIKSNNWASIVTHNAQGEYGHIQHKMLHNIVRDAYGDCYMAGDYRPPLYCFAKYYSKKKLPKDLPSTVSEDSLNQKESLLKVYKSQTKTINKLRHILPYEEFVLFHPQFN